MTRAWRTSSHRSTALSPLRRTPPWAARSAEDVAAAVRWASEQGRAVAVLATGHGGHVDLGSHVRGQPAVVDRSGRGGLHELVDDVDYEVLG